MNFLTFEQSRQFDEYLVNVCGYELAELVEIAAGSVARVVVEEHLVQKQSKTTIFCGNGNNGADGLKIATHLRSCGFNVAVMAATPFTKDINLRLQKQCKALGVTFESSFDQNTALIVDAIFGFGFQSRGIHPDYLQQLIALSAAYPILSVDVPSGSEDGGDALWNPTYVCSLGLPKTCMQNYGGRHFLCSPLLYSLCAKYQKFSQNICFGDHLYVEL